MTNERREYLKREKQRQIEHVNRINANIIPDTPGYVRTNGPRRQYRAHIDSEGITVLTEI